MNFSLFYSADIVHAHVEKYAQVQTKQKNVLHEKQRSINEMISSRSSVAKKVDCILLCHFAKGLCG